MKITIKYTAILLVTLLVFPFGSAMSQTDKNSLVSGDVVDGIGNPMYQVAIMDAAGKVLTTTNLHGHFELDTNEADLHFRRGGYADRQMPATAGMKVMMSTDETRKDDMLDYGYNLLRRRALASEAVSTVTGARLEDIPSSNFSQMLEGQLLGLGTLETSSDPGSTTVDKYVRGISTMHNTAPLVVIDGIVMQDYNIDYLTAAEVENIVLLKDAAATAIYGLKGANGVLVINTKSGLPGTFDVRVTADFSMQQIARKPERLSSSQYASLRNEGWANDGSVGDAPFSANQIDRINAGNDPLYPSNDYYKEFVRNFGTMERIGVSVSGGTNRTRVWSNINFMNQTALFEGDTDKYVATPRRFWVNFRAKVDVDISKRVRAFASVSGNVRNDRLTGDTNANGDIYNSIFSLPPTMVGPVLDDGRVTTMETVSKPTYGILNRSGYTKYSGMYASTQIGLDVDLGFITQGLSVTGKVAFQSSNDRYNYSKQDYRRFYYDYVGGNFTQLGSELDTNLTNSVEGKFQYALSYIAQFDYKREFGKHGVEAHLYTYFTEEQFDKVVSDYPAVGMPHYNHNTGLNLSYNYDDRFVVGATLGLTASDAFARKNRYTFTPAVSAAWVLSNEAFLRDVEWLSLLKVRASYGEVALDNFKVDNYRYLYADYILRNGEVRLLGNPNLEPEIHKIQNYGMEIGLWNKLSLTVDYFRRRTDNMLIENGNRIPMYQGISVSNWMKVNKGQMQNKGFELGLFYSTSIGSDWSVHAGVNYAHTKNKVVYTGEMPYPGAGDDYSEFAYSHREQGFPMGQKFGYLVDRSNNGGYISSPEQLAKYTTMYESIGKPRMGDFIYKDLNNDGLVDHKDMAPIGKGAIPTDYTTFRVGFGWKGLEVDLMFQGVTGYYGPVSYATETTANGIYNDLHLKAWTAERHASGAEIKAPALSYNTASVSTLDNDYLIANRSFWRLKNASISYTLPASLMRNAGVKRLKIVLSGQNLFTTSALESKVIDPETGDMTKLPPMRVINLGVKLDF